MLSPCPVMCRDVCPVRGPGGGEHAGRVHSRANMDSPVGRYHWRPLVNADKAADISSGVLHSSGIFYIIIR